jgi:hypothetical protein
MKGKERNGTERERKGMKAKERHERKGNVSRTEIK